tara:strand:+ start:4388 stop:4858 length:471 start_codon:yes stop_codon:yes gene_type:complete
MGTDTRLRLEILHHPEYEVINPKILKFIEFLDDDLPEESSLIVSKHTGFHTYPKIFVQLSDWVLDNTSFDIKPTDTELWSAVYNEGDYADPHTHTPCTHSFVYYVSAPSGSSPLIFEDRRVDPVPGMCVIFKSNYKHAVPENKCKGRVILAGNYYT